MTEYIKVVTTVDSAEEACPQDTQRNSAGSLVWTMRAVAVRGLRVPVWRGERPVLGRERSSVR